MPREYYSVSEAAKTLGVSVDTVRRWDRQGRLKAERDSANRRVIPASEIERLRGEPGSSQLSARNRFNATVTDVKVEGLIAQVEMIVSEPVRLPSAVGLNVTLIVQLAPAATEPPQVLVSAKSPLDDMVLIASGAVPVLLRVTACAALVVLISWLPKLRPDGDKLTTGATPTPASKTV